jgi:carbonic anhydrase
MLGLELGDAHVIRNAGGQATDDALRSIAISQHLLGTTEVMVVHHTDCGMEKFEDEAVADRIEDATGVRPPVPLGFISDVESSVKDTVAAVQNCGYLKSRDQVRGFLYDVKDGRLREI